MQVKKRVTAKPKPMMNLVSRYSARDPIVLASTASERLGKTRSESQEVPLSLWNEQQPRTGRPVMGASSSNNSQWNVDDKWSSQEWKSGEISNTNTPWVGNSSPRTQTSLSSITMIWTLTPPQNRNLSLKSRLFLNRVNDRLRKMLNRSPQDPVLGDIGSICIHGKESVFMGKNYSENFHSIKNTGKDLTLKQMFDISEKLIVGQSDEIFGVSQISWEDSPWRQLSLVNDEEVFSLFACKGLCIFGFCVMSLEK